MENAQLALQSESMKSRAAAIQARSALSVCNFPESSKPSFSLLTITGTGMKAGVTNVPTRGQIANVHHNGQIFLLSAVFYRYKNNSNVH